MSIDVTDWLRELGLEQYAQAFRDNDIDGDILAALTAGDLAELGVRSVGHRRKMLAAIAAAHPPEPQRPATPDTARDTAGAAEGILVERRQLTIMFCDLVGSTELATRLDPEDLRDIIAVYHQRVSEIVIRYGGFAARLMGDGVLAYFGYPQAHEEDAERSVRAGLAIVKAIASIGLSHPLQVRIGIATGLVVVGDLIGTGAGQEQTVVGETPNLAARLQTVAAPNTVVVADGTRRQIGTLFEMLELGPFALKGFTGEQRVWQVLGESGVVNRFVALRTAAAPLVGRGEELDMLVRRWTQAKTGEGRVVLLSAEAGIGKSRLTEALIECIAAENPNRLRYFCSPHHEDSALFPIIGQLERAARFARDDPPAVQIEKLAALLGDSDIARGNLPIFAELLSLGAAPLAPAPELSPQRKKEMTFDALMRHLEALASERPTLIVFEDLHWIDPTTRELLDRTIARIERLPVLLIATFRPEFPAPWTGQPHVTMVALTRLGRREGTALVSQLLANAAALPAEIIDEIIERSDGVPLFLEEVTKVVFEAAVSTAAAGISGPRLGPRLAVPATLQASLMARLDRLGAAAREIAQVGAAIGRDFSYELLRAAGQRNDEETNTALDRLVAAGLVFQRGLPPAAQYQFKHALVQDTAYGTLLRGPRQALHGRIAAALQEQSADIVERSPETLAHHLTEAGDVDGAALYWLEAGRRASGRSANIEAAAHLARGIGGLCRLEETPERLERELELQLALGPVLLSTRGYGAPEARRPYHRAGELATRLSDDRARFAATWGLWITTHGGGRDDAERLRQLDELVRIAERIADPELSLQAHHSAWATWIWGGEFIRSQEHIHHGIALYDAEKHRHHALMYGGHDPGVCGKGQSAVALWVLGYPDQAARRAGEAIVLAEQLRHVPSILHAVWFATSVAHLRRDLTAERAYSERLMTLGREHGLKQHETIGGIFHGWVLTQTGSAAEGLAELRSRVDFYGATAWTMLALFRALLAEAELRAGHFEPAAKALDDTGEIGNRWWWAEVLRLRGDLQQSGFTGADPEAAGQSYREAISVAQGQQARSLELRAATSLARLWQRDNRVNEARDALAPICGWFSEGLDTPDLVDAQALLAELT